jgi:hypothetical protein
MFKVKRNKPVKRLQDTKKGSANLAIRSEDLEDGIETETRLIQEDEIQEGDEVMEVLFASDKTALSCYETQIHQQSALDLQRFITVSNSKFYTVC